MIPVRKTYDEFRIYLNYTQAKGVGWEHVRTASSREEGNQLVKEYKLTYKARVKVVKVQIPKPRQQYLMEVKEAEKQRRENKRKFLAQRRRWCHGVAAATEKDLTNG